MLSGNQAWKLGCFDSNHSSGPDCRMSSHRTCCRISKSCRSYWLQSWYSANQAGCCPCLVTRQATLQSIAFRERYERFLRSKKSYLSSQNFISFSSFIYVARMGGLRSRVVQNSHREISTEFQNLFSFVFLSVWVGQEWGCPKGWLAQSCLVVRQCACFQCLRRHSRVYPSEI